VLLLFTALTRLLTPAGLRQQAETEN